jgi:DNA-binding XRE family transcriptional regulator
MARAFGQALSSATKGESAVRVLRGGSGGERVGFDIAGCTVPPAHFPSSPLDDNVVLMMSDKTTVAKRLKRAREQAGYATAADFARAWNFNSTTYYHHENGRRDIRPDIAKRYAAILKLPAGMLLYGEQLQSVASVRIVGQIAATGQIVLQSSGISAQSVVLPNASELVGLRVLGDDLYPAYRAGDVVFHRPLNAESGFAISMLHGCECVVELEDGSILLRQIVVQSDGRATLIAYHAPPLINQTIVAAAPVEVVQRALPAHLIVS